MNQFIGNYSCLPPTLMMSVAVMCVRRYVRVHLLCIHQGLTRHVIHMHAHAQ